MKFSYSLLKKIVSTAPSSRTVAQALNDHSFELESLDGDTIDLKLSANRYGDASSHIGIARELCAIFGLRLANPVKRIVNAPTRRNLVRVTVEDSSRCARYSARVFDAAAVGESEAWVKKVLLSCGMKPINAIVDIMNFVMLETGQPLHAFDADTLSVDGKGRVNISVRNGRNGESLVTLDKQTVPLDPSVLVIADHSRPLAIAGIKGGMHSGVTAKTKRIVVEAANFDAPTIWKTSRRIKIATDASVRFGHGLSPALVDWGMDRATELLKKVGCTLLDSVDVYPKKATDKVVGFDVGRYEKLIGIPVSVTDAKHCFQSLGFAVEIKTKKRLPANARQERAGSAHLTVRVPAWRLDVETFEDLAEEVTRLFGYNDLPKTAPVLSIGSAQQDDTVTLKDKVRSLCSAYGLEEVYTDSFVEHHQTVGKRHSSMFFHDGAESLEVENPIASDKRYLRMSLLTNLLQSARDNTRFFDSVRLFEIGTVFARQNNIVFERMGLAAALMAKNNALLVREARGFAEALLEQFGVTDIVFRQDGNLLLVETDHHVLGSISHTEVSKGWQGATLEVNLSSLLGQVEEERAYTPLPKYPAVVRDVSVFVADSVRIGDVLQAIQEADNELIEDVDLIDEYRSPEGRGKQSLTFRIVCQAADRTLTDEEVNLVISRIEEKLRERFVAHIR